MHLEYTAEQHTFRAEVRAWMEAHVPKEPLVTLECREGYDQHVEWERTLASGNWGMVTWPEAYGGRGLDLIQWLVVEEEYFRVGGPNRANQNGIFLLGPTIMEFGTDEQKKRFLTPMAKGEVIWAQAWSEPGAGSDMAAISSKAVRDGDYRFSMPQRIPSYLLAIAVGDVVFEQISARSGVWAEPSVAEAAATEFADTERMIQVTEKLYGPYQWGRYDMLILPASFPFGGMENPRLSFITPTVIVGDKSLTSLIAHELAHSWSGNLVTNATWDDFWLNEGFTVYIEHRIMEELYGKELSNTLCEIEHFELIEELKSIASSSHPEDSRLYLSLKGRNPDDGMTSVAYVKGAYFLKTLEATVGRRKMDAFVKAYFDQYKFKTIRTELFHTFLNKNLLYPNNIEFNTDEWFYLEGLPMNSITIKSKRLELMRSYAERTNRGEDIFAPIKKIRWVKVKGKKKKRKQPYTEQLDTKAYITQEWQTYLRSLSLSIVILIIFLPFILG